VRTTTFPSPSTSTNWRGRALARRAAPRAGDASGIEQGLPDFCGMRCDGASGAAYFNGEVMDLAPRELALLRSVLSRPGHAVAREQLLEAVFPGDQQVQAEAIEVVAYRLRKKLAGTGTQLVTLRGLGYLLRADA
jgi:two-component system response regulator TctD